VFLTNVREDHLDTLGRDRTQIARSLTRAVPQGTSVVCAEQYKPLREYIQTELERRDAPVTFVDPPSGTESVPGSECVYGLNDVLAAVGEPPVPTLRDPGPNRYASSVVAAASWWSGVQCGGGQRRPEHGTRSTVAR